MDKKKIKTVSERFCISQPCAKKYIHMSEEAIEKLNAPTEYKKRATIMDDYINIIFKMLYDGLGDDLIYYYVLRQGYSGSTNSLWEYIKCVEVNNFPERIPFNPKYLLERVYPEDVIVIKRNALLKYLFTLNPKTKKDKVIGKYEQQIKETYPACAEMAKIFRTFHTILMGSDIGALDQFIEKYNDSKIAGFCNGTERDIAPVKNAISLKVSSGFVEGNNNKFKLIKRIVYGRSGLVNLSKKCFLAFRSNDPTLNLFNLI